MGFGGENEWWRIRGMSSFHLAPNRTARWAVEEAAMSCDGVFFWCHNKIAISFKPKSMCFCTFVALVLTILQTKTELLCLCLLVCLCVSQKLIFFYFYFLHFLYFWGLMLLGMLCIHVCWRECSTYFLARLACRFAARVCMHSYIKCLRENVRAAPGYLSV